MATDVHTEVLYSAEQIKIPPELHGVLKEYTKAVIRSQPENILQFSAKYFKELHELQIQTNNLSKQESDETNDVPEG